MRCDVRVETLTDGTIVEEQTIAERLVRAAIRAYRMYPFTDVDAAVVADVAGLPLDAVSRASHGDALLLVTYDHWTGCASRPGVAPPLRDRPRPADPRRGRRRPGPRPGPGRRDQHRRCRNQLRRAFRKRYEDYVVELAVGLRRDFDAGMESSVVPAGRAATQLLALYEGLQIQLLVRPDLDALAEFD